MRSQQTMKPSDVFASWTQDAERVYTKQSAFDAMWGDYEPSIKVLEFPEIRDEVLRKYRRTKTIDTSLDEDSDAPEDPIDHRGPMGEPATDFYCRTSRSVLCGNAPVSA